MNQLQQYAKLLCSLLLVVGIVNSQQTDEFPQCTSVELDTFIAVIDDCSSYIYCNGENSFRDTCPVQTYFDGNSQECAFDDAGVCLHATATTTVQTTNVLGEAATTEQAEEASTTTAASPTATPPAGSRPQCATSGDGYHAHPDRCEYYYSCLGGYLSIVRCPYKFGWDYAEGRCKPMAEAQCFSL
ncbi:hypothetical protein KR044_013046 [Drosophila immigrans]|nr:hypothetical protein KR044_013046 [Drosophila immigrans]